MRGKQFNKRDDDYIKENFPNMTTKFVADKMGRSAASVNYRACQLGVKKDKAYLNLNAGRLKGTEGQAYRFKKGHVSFNKGKKMETYASRDAIARIQHTQFKKGAQPHNVKWDGAERITKDGYVEVRVSMGKWKLKQRLVWEMVHGSIPKGSVVRFRDGNKLNTELSNLELCTRGQLALNNSIHRYPVDVKKSIRLVHKLNKLIKNEANKH